MPRAAWPAHFDIRLVASADVVAEAYWQHQDELRTLLKTRADAEAAAAMDATWWRCSTLGAWFRMALQVI